MNDTHVLHNIKRSFYTLTFAFIWESCLTIATQSLAFMLPLPSRKMKLPYNLPLDPHLLATNASCAFCGQLSKSKIQHCFCSLWFSDKRRRKNITITYESQFDT